MARKVKAKAGAEPQDPLPGQMALATPSGRSLRWTVQARPRSGAAPVFALEMEEGWRGTQAELDDLAQEAASFRGAYVRLHAAPGMPAEVALRARAALVQHGARAVRVVRAREGKVALPDKGERRPRAGIRATVERMVAEANTRDRAALAALVGQAMSEAGL